MVQQFSQIKLVGNI